MEKLAAGSPAAPARIATSFENQLASVVIATGIDPAIAAEIQDHQVTVEEIVAFFRTLLRSLGAQLLTTETFPQQAPEPLLE